MRIRAELWDNMQYYFKDYNDVTMRCALYFDGIFNLEVFKFALSSVVGKFPILTSRFVANPIKSYWKPNGKFGISDFFEYREIGGVDIKKPVSEFVTRNIDPKKGPQLNVAVFRANSKGKASDCLAMVFSHMVSDGSGFSLFLKALVDTYNNMLTDSAYECKYSTGDRDYKQFYKYMSKADIKRAKEMTSYRMTDDERLKLPLKHDYRNDFKRRILEYRFDGFNSVRMYCKENGFTFNDVILAAYMTALFKEIELKDKQTLAVDCVLNLRRYMPQDLETNFCNLVSKVKVNIGDKPGKSFADTCKLTHDFMENSKDNLGGLGGLTLLNLMDTAFPFAIGRVLIKLFYQNPMIGLSNIGKLDATTVGFNGLKLSDLLMTGSIKYPPYMMLSLITYGDSIFFSIPVACADEDLKVFERLLLNVALELKKTLK